MPHIMKPCLTKDDHNKNPIGILKLMTQDKTVKPQDVFEGFKPPSKLKKRNQRNQRNQHIDMNRK